MRRKDGSLEPEILGTAIEDNLIPLYHCHTVYQQHLTCSPSPQYNLRIGQTEASSNYIQVHFIVAVYILTLCQDYMTDFENGFWKLLTH